MPIDPLLKIREAVKEMLGLLSLPAGIREVEKLANYLSLIQLGARNHRLVGDKDLHTLIYKHLFDSLYPLTVMKLEKEPLMDLGTGAGLPGVPLKIFLPELPVYLVDSNHRKMNFVKHVCRDLKLKKVIYLTDRAERLAGDVQYRETFGYVFSRALARVNLLVEMALPFVAPGGQLVMYKGPAAQIELTRAQSRVKLLGGRVNSMESYKLPTGEQRVLIVIEKTAGSSSGHDRERI